MSAYLTVLKTVYHRPEAGAARAQRARWTRRLASAEAPYLRTLTATATWQPLDCGWVEEVGLLLVTNDEGGRPRPRPSAADQAALAARTLELAYDAEPPWLIAPGESFVGRPGQARSLRVRCRSETARYTVAVYPS